MRIYFERLIIKINAKLYLLLFNTSLLPIIFFLNLFKNNGLKIMSSKKKICMIYEPRFRYIVSEFEKNGYNVIFIARKTFENLFFHFCKNYIKDRDRNKHIYCHLLYIKAKKERKQYYDAGRKVSKIIKRILKTNKIILPKINDDYTIEVVNALTDTGWKTFVYDREGTVSPKRLEYVPPILSQYDIRASAIICYNERHTKVIKASNINGNIKGDIHINGNPYGDYWFDDKKELSRPLFKTNEKQRTVLYFSFGIKNYIHHYYDDDLEVDSYNWKDMLTEIHDVFFNYFSNSNDILIYKYGHKTARDHFEGSEKLRALKNVHTCQDNFDANQLIKESDLIIGFQTTALLEALYTDIPIIYPSWGNTHEKIKDTMIEFHHAGKTKGVFHADSIYSFENLLKDNDINDKINFESRKKFRMKYMNNEDGMAAQRFVKIVENY